MEYINPPHVSVKTPEKYLLKNLPRKTQLKDAKYFAWQKLQSKNSQLGKMVQTWQQHKASNIKG